MAFGCHCEAAILDRSGEKELTSQGGGWEVEKLWRWNGNDLVMARGSGNVAVSPMEAIMPRLLDLRAEAGSSPLVDGSQISVIIS